MTSSAQTDGLVIRLLHRGARVVLGTEEFDATLRGRLLQGEQEFTSRVAAGDRVELERCAEGWVITGVLPRRTALSRVRRMTRQEQVLVANVEQACFVISLCEPAFRPFLIDRFLIAGQRGGFESVLLFTKTDLIDQREEFEDWARLYRGLGVTVHFVSTVSGEGLDAVRAQLANRISVVAGQSGVGKSSLLNALQPELGLTIGELSKHWSKGRHTTTASSLHRFAGGGWIADTPGVRSFALPRLEAAEVASYFQDFLAAAGSCRFASCTHRHEPDCGVQQAVNSGTIDERRYESYLRIVEGVDEDEEG